MNEIAQIILWTVCGIVGALLVIFIIACILGHHGNKVKVVDGKWRARRRLIFLGLPWTFTVYECDDESLRVKTGVLTQKEEDIKLYRILDIGPRRTLLQRMLGLGTITLASSDRSAGSNLAIENIRAPRDTKDWISDVVEKKRDEKRVSAREYMTSDIDDDTDDLDEEN